MHLAVIFCVATRSISKRSGDLGYVEGKNILSRPDTPGESETGSLSLANELVASLKVDVIVVVGGTLTAAKIKPQAQFRLSRRLPEKLLRAQGDLAGRYYNWFVGYVASLAKPGGNITGRRKAPAIDADLGSR